MTIHEKAKNLNTGYRTDAVNALIVHEELKKVNKKHSVVDNRTPDLSKLFQYLKFFFTGSTADRTRHVIFKLKIKQNKKITIISLLYLEERTADISN